MNTIENYLRILFLNKFFYLKGGSEKVFFDEMDLMQKHGHTSFPFSREHPKNVASNYSSYFAPELNLDEKFSFHSLKSAIDIIYSHETKYFLNKLILREKPDIAHAHNIYGLLTTSVLDELFYNGIPTVLTLHDYKIICPNYQFLDHSKICEKCKPNRYYQAIINRCVHGSLLKSSIYSIENYFNFFMKKYLRKVAKFIAVCRFLKDKFIEYGYPEEKIAFIPNFIDTQFYHPSYEDHHYFLYFGRIVPEKGIETLINAFTNLKTTQYRLVLVGDGPLKPILQERIERSNLQNIELSGFLSGKALSEKIKNCTCAIMPSEIYENCPMAVLEAMAYGKPVIGANIGGIPELIDINYSGVIFESGDVSDLSSKMEHMAIMSTKERRQMGKYARMKVESQYNPNTHYDSLISLYDEFI